MQALSIHDKHLWEVLHQKVSIRHPKPTLESQNQKVNTRKSTLKSQHQKANTRKSTSESQHWKANTRKSTSTFGRPATLASWAENPGQILSEDIRETPKR